MTANSLSRTESQNEHQDTPEKSYSRYHDLERPPRSQRGRAWSGWYALLETAYPSGAPLNLEAYLRLLVKTNWSTHAAAKSAHRTTRTLRRAKAKLTALGIGPLVEISPESGQKCPPCSKVIKTRVSLRSTLSETSSVSLRSRTEENEEKTSQESQEPARCPDHRELTDFFRQFCQLCQAHGHPTPGYLAACAIYQAACARRADTQPWYLIAWFADLCKKYKPRKPCAYLLKTTRNNWLEPRERKFRKPPPVICAIDEPESTAAVFGIPTPAAPVPAPPAVPEPQICMNSSAPGTETPAPPPRPVPQPRSDFRTPPPIPRPSVPPRIGPPAERPHHAHRRPQSELVRRLQAEIDVERRRSGNPNAPPAEPDTPDVPDG